MEREAIKKLEPAISTDQLIERMREYNEAGHIRGMMVVFFYPDGNIGTHWATIPSVTRAVGALERLKIAILCDAGDT